MMVKRKPLDKVDGNSKITKYFRPADGINNKTSSNRKAPPPTASIQSKPSPNSNFSNHGEDKTDWGFDDEVSLDQLLDSFSYNPPTSTSNHTTCNRNSTSDVVAGPDEKNLQTIDTNDNRNKLHHHHDDDNSIKLQHHHDDLHHHEQHDGNKNQQRSTYLHRKHQHPHDKEQHHSSPAAPHAPSIPFNREDYESEDESSTSTPDDSNDDDYVPNRDYDDEITENEDLIESYILSDAEDQEMMILETCNNVVSGLPPVTSCTRKMASSNLQKPVSSKSVASASVSCKCDGTNFFCLFDVEHELTFYCLFNIH
jgi:hypothetical protein